MKKQGLFFGLIILSELISAQGPAFWDINGNGNIGANNFIGTTSSADFLVKTNSAERIRVLGSGVSAGFVGIGTPSPRQKLDVGGNLAISGTKHLIYNSFDGNLTWGHALTGDLHFNVSNFQGLTNQGLLERMTIKGDNGYVGIGAPAPQAKLHITSSIERESFRVYFAGSGNYLSMYQGAGAGVIDPIGTGKLYLGYDPAADVYIGGNNNGVNPYSKLGIGTDNPVAFLNIKTPDINWHGFLLEHNSTAANTAAEIRIKNNGSAAFLISNWVNSPVNVFKVEGNGRTTIGNPLLNSSPHYNDYLLSVKGKGVFQEIIVTNQDWSDFVFDDSYKLRSLADVESYYKANKHLPEIPSAKEVSENGVSVGEINKLLLQKIEELTIYLVEQQKEIEKLKKEKK
jgi:hypothetical protein